MIISEPKSIVEQPFVQIALTETELESLMFHLRNTSINGKVAQLYNELYDYQQEHE